LPPITTGGVFQHGGHVLIHRDIGERHLKAHAGGNVDVEYEFLERLFYVLEGKIVVADERRENHVETGNGLRARGFALECVKEVHKLPESGPEMFGRRAFDVSGDALEPFA
jgi:hypothetical protein